MASGSEMLRSWGGGGRFARTLSSGIVALALALAVVALGACGGDDEGETTVSAAELTSRVTCSGALQRTF
jgi:hypothetical protein